MYISETLSMTPSTRIRKAADVEKSQSMHQRRRIPAIRQPAIRINHNRTMKIERKVVKINPAEARAMAVVVTPVMENENDRNENKRMNP